MSKYLYATVYEEFTGLKPPEPTDNKQRRKRGYGHPYRMRLNMQEETEHKQKKPERRNQFGQPIVPRKHREETFSRNTHDHKEHAPQFNAGRKARVDQERRSNSGYNPNRMTDCGQNASPLTSMPQEHKSSPSAPKVTYKKRRAFGATDDDHSS